MKSMIGIFFIAVFAAIGLALIGYALWSARRSSIASSWPVTPGQVESCSLESETDSDDATTYEVKVRYAYTVNGKQFTGTRLAFGYSASSGRDTHLEICNKLQQAKSVDVRFDPNDPSNSTLSFGLHRSIRLLFAFGVTWLGFIAGLAVVIWIISQRDDVLLRNLIVR